MAFFKFRSAGQQGNDTRSAPAAPAPAESIEAMRRRARHRLLGAAVLVLIGVIGFPLLFDTQPRPVAVDIPIEIPDRNKAKPLVIPPTPATAPAASGKSSGSSAPASDDGVITEAADGTEIPSSKLAAVAPPPEVKSEPAPKPEVKPEPKPEPKAKPEPKTE